MELTLQSIKSGLFIKNYENHSLYIDDEIYRNNVLVTSTAVKNWNFNNKDNLDINDFSNVLDYKPEIIILGTGGSLVIPTSNIINNIQNQGIGFEFMITESACKTFNLLVSENRKVAAVLIL
jgi:uncharacterized protein|tara:strand:- start:435 stop:800 length:366 start_codon:yes stop_codon:yes gene_type:complete